MTYSIVYEYFTLINLKLMALPDKGFPNFKRYIGLAVAAYNLQRIGKRLIEIDKQKKQQEKQGQQLTQAA